MLFEPSNLVSDIENVISSRPDKVGAMLRRITDLFLSNIEQGAAEQLDVYDEVLTVFVCKIGVAARAELARRLAPIDKAPKNVIRLLALDGAIEVAEPVLARSVALDDNILSDCMVINGQDHLLAIATRNSLSEMVTDQLIKKGDRKVLGVVVNNPGAAISDPSYGTLVERSAGDDWLLKCVARRPDIPEHHFRELILKASEVVREELLAEYPELNEAIRQLFPNSVPSNSNSTKGLFRDYRTAELVVRGQPITEALVLEFAEAKKLEEVIVSIAELSSLSTAEIERLVMSRWSSPVAVILKAIGFHLAALEALYFCRLLPGEQPGDDLVQTKAEFIALKRATAERIMRFYATRKAAKISNLSPGHRIMKEAAAAGIPSLA
jgi:Uncharacterised protein conserved in bacteria (DUF2336)